MVKTNRLILTTSIGIILLLNVALAIPGIPHQFYGSVIYNGQPAPDGLLVVAKINGVEVASTTTSDGKYGYDSIFYVDDPNNERSGKIISFFVNGIDTGQTYPFQNGGVTRLDLTATGPSPTTTTTSGTTGGGGGSVGGEGTTVTTITTTTIVTQTTTSTCVEKWTCTEWGPCVNGIQTRKCTDENNCGTDFYKPMESQPCSEEETERQKSPLTGLIAFISLPMNIALMAPIILTLIVLTIFLVRKYSSEKKPY